MTGVVDRCGYFSFVDGVVRKVSRHSRHCVVLILVYMEMALYVKRQACGGSDMVLKICFSSKEFLKYVLWHCTRGGNCLSTHFLRVCGSLAQSDNTGCFSVGVLWSFAIK